MRLMIIFWKEGRKENTGSSSCPHEGFFNVLKLAWGTNFVPAQCSMSPPLKRSHPRKTFCLGGCWSALLPSWCHWTAVLQEVGVTGEKIWWFWVYGSIF